MQALLHQILDDAARRWPKQVAIVGDSGELTYEELSDASRRIASGLRDRGVRRSDRVLVISPNRPEVIALCFATSRLGAIHVVIDPDVKPFHLDHIIRDADPRAVLTDSDFPHLFAANPRPLQAEVAPSDPVSLTYTSGSTALPKAVIATHANVLFVVDAILRRLEYRTDDSVFCCLPLSFDYALYQAFLSARVGASLLLQNTDVAGPALLATLTRYRPSVVPIVPLLAEQLIRLVRKRDGRGPDSVRLFTSTGATLTRTHIAGLQGAFPQAQIAPMFGLTECKRVSILHPSELSSHAGSVGRPLEGTQCLIVDPDRHPLPPRTSGELLVRGHHVMAGYWRAPELSAARFFEEPTGVRSLLTGDECWMDDQGYLYFVGRHDDIFKNRGYRMSTIEIEAAALSIEGVESATVVAPTADTPFTIVAITRHSSDAVLAELARRLPRAKVPDVCLVVNQLPTGINWKLDRASLQRIIETNRS